MTEEEEIRAWYGVAKLQGKPTDLESYTIRGAIRVGKKNEPLPRWFKHVSESVRLELLAYDFLMAELLSLCHDLSIGHRKALVYFKPDGSKKSGWLPVFDGIVIRLKDWPKLRRAMQQPRLRNMEMTLT